MEYLLLSDQTVFHRELLKKALTRLFGQLDKVQFDAIENYFQWIQLPGGEILMREGEEGNSSYILLTGRLRAVIGSDRNEKVIGEISEGEMVGEMSLITGAPRSATIYAIRDCVLVKLLKADFEKIVMEFPSTLMKITQLLINRLVIQNQGKGSRARIDNLAFINLSKKIQTNQWVEQLKGQLNKFGTVAILDPERVNQHLGIPDIANSSSEEYEKYNRLSSWLDYQEQQYDYLIYNAEAGQVEWSKRCLRQADYVFLLIDDFETGAWPEVKKNYVERLSGISRADQCLIICHHSQQAPQQTSLLRHGYKVKEHFHFNMDSTADFARLARKIAGKSIGLVLSGGGARGIAHIGVYRALLEHGFPVDLCGGTSIGSLIGAFIASRMPLEELIRLTRKEFMRNPTSDYSLFPFISIIKGNKLDKALLHCFEDQQIEDLWIPYFCVSSNLSKWQAEHLTTGPLRQAVRASISIPGVLPPVVKQSDVFVDGGIFNNLPIDYMQEFGAGTILAVNLNAGSTLQLHENIKPSNWSYLKSRYLASIEEGYDKIPGLINTLTRATIASSYDRANRNLSLVNILFTPAVQRYGIMNWKSFDKILEEGYLHASAILAKIEVSAYA